MKPPNWQQTDDPLRSTEELMELIPDDFSEAYDMHDVIKVLVDDGDCLEIKDEYAKNLRSSCVSATAAMAIPASASPKAMRSSRTSGLEEKEIAQKGSVSSTSMK